LQTTIPSVSLAAADIDLDGPNEIVFLAHDRLAVV